MGFKVEGLGFRVQGLGFIVQARRAGHALARVKVGGVKGCVPRGGFGGRGCQIPARGFIPEPLRVLISLVSI